MGGFWTLYICSPTYQVYMYVIHIMRIQNKIAHLYWTPFIHTMYMHVHTLYFPSSSVSLTFSLSTILFLETKSAVMFHKVLAQHWYGLEFSQILTKLVENFYLFGFTWNTKEMSKITKVGLVDHACDICSQDSGEVLSIQC